MTEVPIARRTLGVTFSPDTTQFIVVAALYIAQLCHAQTTSPFTLDWADNTVVLLDDQHNTWINILTGDTITCNNPTIGQLLNTVPIAVLQSSARQ